MARNKRTTTPTVVTDKDVATAVKIASAYRQRRKGVTHKDTTAALKTVNAYVRQREAQVRVEAKRLGLKGSPAAQAQKLLDELLNED
jgi:hypothetical protein